MYAVYFATSRRIIVTISLFILTMNWRTELHQCKNPSRAAGLEQQAPVAEAGDWSCTTRHGQERHLGQRSLAYLCRVLYDRAIALLPEPLRTWPRR